MRNEVVRALLESKRVKLKHEEMLVVGRIAEYHIVVYSEASNVGTEALGEASRVYALYRKLATRVLTPRSSYRVSFSPSEQGTLLHLINQYYHLFGVFERTVVYKLRQELELR